MNVSPGQGASRMRPIPTPSLTEADRRLIDAADAKAAVLAALALIVEGGGAVITLSGDGRRELRMATGEFVRLGEETITRIA